MNALDNLIAWRAVMIAAQTGSLTETAERLGMELSKVSRLVTIFEREMGFQFFDKTTRPYRPTTKLRALVNAAQPHLKSLNETAASFRVRDEAVDIHFAAPIEISRLYFSKVLSAYCESQGNIRFALEPEATLAALMAGTVDAVVLSEVPAYTPDLIVRLYHITSTPVLATPEYLRKHGIPKTPADLSRHTGLLLKTVNLNPVHCLYRNGEASDILNWKSVFISHDQIALKELLLEHRGLTVDLSLAHVIDELERGRICAVLPGWERAPWHMCVVTRRDREEGFPELRKFAEFVATKTSEDWIAMTERGREAIRQATVSGR